MKDDISAALQAFYVKILEPEFRSLKERLSEYDEKLVDILNHVDSIYDRFEKLEQEYDRVKINPKQGNRRSLIKEVLKPVDVTQSVRFRYYQKGKSDRTKV